MAERSASGLASRNPSARMWDNDSCFGRSRRTSGVTRRVTSKVISSTPSATSRRDWLAIAVAHRAETSCHLVHATPGSGHAPRRDSYPYTRRYEQASVQVAAALGDRVPAAVLKSLAVHRGKPAAILNEAVAALGAELVVLGGEHHSTLRRWLGGSTSVEVARTALVPLLVAVGAPAIRRVLLALDPSAAARPAAAAAERYAALFGAELRALSVVEPLAVVPEVPQQETTDYYRPWGGGPAPRPWPPVRAPRVGAPRAPRPA